MLKKALLYFVGAFITAVVGLVSSSVFTRIFSKEEFGTYSLAMSAIMTISVFTNQWIQQAISRYLPVHQDEKEIERKKNSIVLAISLETIVLIFLTGIVFSVQLVFMDMQWAYLILPAAMYLVAINIYSILGVVLQTEMQAKTYSLLNTSNAIIKLLLGIFMSLNIARHISSLFWAGTFSVLLFIPLLWVKARLVSPLKLLTNYSVREYCRELKEFAKYGVPMTMWYISANILSIGDRYIIQSIRGTGEVGIYSANYNVISAAVGLVGMPVLLTAHPFLMKAWSTGDREATGRWLGRIVEGVLCFGTLLTALTWVFSKDLAEWFLGPQFREGHFIMPVVVAGVVFWQLGMYTQKPMEFVKSTGSLVCLCLVSAAVNVASNLILIPKYGYAAAAYTTLASYAVYFATSYVASKKILSWNIDKSYLLLNLSAICGLFYVVIYSRHIFREYLNPTMSLTTMMGICATISVVYSCHVVSRLKRPL